jgi:hypothetical protein
MSGDNDEAKLGQHTKVRIAVQGLELETEGSQQFVESQLPGLMEKLAELQRAGGAVAVAPAANPSTRAANTYESVPMPQVSANTIASLSNASTGSDLVMAAMAYLTLIQQKDAVPRAALLEEMKAATTFYKDSYSGNLSQYIDSLVKAKRINLVAKNTYALPNAERQHFAQLIRNSA